MSDAVLQCSCVYILSFALNSQTETDYISAKLKASGLQAGNIFEFGCGTGKHGRRLGELGYQVYGIDLSQKMIDLAVATEKFNCDQGDIRFVSLDRNFDAVISLFHVMSYQIDNASVNAVFCNASRHLNKGGLFIFDFWYQPAVTTQIPATRFKKIVTDEVVISRFADPTLFPNENRVDVNYSITVADLRSKIIGEIEECHSMRYFSLPEIDLFCQLNGFKLICSEEFLSGDIPSQDTWGVCVVLEKL